MVSLLYPWDLCGLWNLLFERASATLPLELATLDRLDQGRLQSFMRKLATTHAHRVQPQDSCSITCACSNDYRCHDNCR